MYCIYSFKSAVDVHTEQSDYNMGLSMNFSWLNLLIINLFICITSKLDEPARRFREQQFSFNAFIVDFLLSLLVFIHRRVLFCFSENAFILYIDP